jgi:AcrR family transcriptional regulator
MGRHKTISDDEVLRIARGVFRARGHIATTREIAEAAGISEAVLYQRFGSKDHLFFAAMHARGPDLEELLGPAEPLGDAREYLYGVVARLAKYFGEVIPLALHMMMHPAFDHSAMRGMETDGPAELKADLARRLTSLARRGKIEAANTNVTARLLISLAHDFALSHVMAHGSPKPRELKEMLDVVWQGVRPNPL